MKQTYKTNDEAGKQDNPHEPASVYQTEEPFVEETAYLREKIVEDNREIDDYIWDDLTVSLEQYEKGEYVSAENLLKRIKLGI
ncbi:hypothetical protein LJC54_10035 [Parabacteroides sp. OttesenSCG-928-J18]|nr:hypothetical protein [Parabacteroides sp. OttesenSCG-928-J18]